jgi:4-amino-4-deoxy-L-arabinose transferase-like glycosyltransferase
VTEAVYDNGFTARMVAIRRWYARRRAGVATWERPALLALLAVSAVLYIVNLSASGWANSFYSAAAQAGSQNWEAFFFGSSDAANSITVDKPPASIWLMALSVRMLGLSPFAILLPEALLGVATVAVTYLTVRRRFPAGTALLAGGILALTPVATLMFRYDNPDALLVFLLATATYFTLRGVESGRMRWVVAAGTMVGFAFLTKQLQAFLILPVLAGVYLWAAPVSLPKRIGHALAALAAVVVSAGWWVAIVQLVPPDSRPYVGGSQSNSFLELTLGYNGLGRLTGDETGSVTGGAGAHWGYVGIDRLFSGDIAGQVTWLMFAALAFIGTSLFIMRRLPRTSSSRATVLLLGGTLVVTALAFSYMAGIFHSYYTVAFAPALAATAAIGAGMLWSRRLRTWPRIALAVALAATATWTVVLLFRYSAWVPWMPAVVVLLAAAALLPLLSNRTGRRTSIAMAGFALVSVLLAPLAFTLETVATGHKGAVVAAGPGGSGTILPRPPSLVNPASALRVPGLAISRGNLLDAGMVAPGVAVALSRDADSYTWLAAAVGSNIAAGYQLATGYPVMPVGGFNGSDPSPTLEQFQDDVEHGRIHWFITGLVARANGGSDAADRISKWVVGNFPTVTMGGTRFFDLTKPLA